MQNFLGRAAAAAPAAPATAAAAAAASSRAASLVGFRVLGIEFRAGNNERREEALHGKQPLHVSHI